MRIVVLMPNWLGDAVMATPFLRGLRGVYPEAHIAAVARPLVAPVLGGLAFVDEVAVFGKGEEGRIIGWMKRGGFEVGVSLPNSFRSAWILWRGGVRRRIGYGRGGRSWLLSDRAVPVMRSASQRAADREKSAVIARLGGGAMNIGSAFEPVAAIDCYLNLLRLLASDGAPPESRRLFEDRRMTLAITEEERVEAEAALAQLEDGKSRIENPVILVPGANFGASKCWPAERFGALAARLADPVGAFRAEVLLAGSPSEMPIVDAILGAVPAHREQVHALPKLNGGKGISLGALKELVHRARLMICNDTGPRHFAAALGTPVVTLFGPTDPRWAETFFEKERLVRAEPFPPCGPCQLKKCPIDHRCMTGIPVESVLNAAKELWNSQITKPDPFLASKL